MIAAARRDTGTSIPLSKCTSTSRTRLELSRATDRLVNWENRSDSGVCWHPAANVRDTEARTESLASAASPSRPARDLLTMSLTQSTGSSVAVMDDVRKDNQISLAEGKTLKLSLTIDAISSFFYISQQVHQKLMYTSVRHSAAAKQHWASRAAGCVSRF